MIQHERRTGPAGGCRRRAADSRLPEGPLSIPPQTTNRARRLPPVRSATTGSPHRIRSISTVTRNALSRNAMHASGRVQRCDDQPAPTQRSSDISTLPASSRVFTAAQPLLDHRRKPVAANEQVVQRMYACRSGCASARSTSTGLLRGALHQYRRVIARVSSSVRAGLCPARGRIRPANTAVPVGRCTHIRASRRRPLPPGLCWCRQRGRTAAVRTEENRLRIGKITIGSLGDWTPTPGPVTSWHPTAAAAEKVRQAPASPVPVSYMQGQHLRNYHERTAAGLDFSRQIIATPSLIHL